MAAVDAGADINARDAACNTPLIWAARGVSREIAAELFDLKVNFAAVNNDGKTAREFAAERDDELTRRIDEAVARFDSAMGVMIDSGKFNDALAEFDKRGLNVDLPLANGDTALVLAARSTSSDEGAVTAFFDALLARGASANWPAIARGSVKARHLTLLPRALAYVPADLSLAYGAQIVDKGQYTAQVVALLFATPSRTGAVEDWWTVAAEIQDGPSATTTLQSLLDNGADIATAQKALEEAAAYVYNDGTEPSGAALRFFFSHGVDVPPKSRTLNKLIQFDWHVHKLDLELIEMALDHGARADVPSGEYDYAPPKLMFELFTQLYSDENRKQSFDGAQLARVIQKMAKAGASLDPDWNDTRSLAQRVLAENAHEDLRPAILAALGDVGVDPPSLCSLIGRYDLSLIEVVIKYRKFSANSESDAYDCAGKVGLQLSGTPSDRIALMRLLVTSGVGGRAAALAKQIDKISAGGGDIGTVDALTMPADKAVFESEDVIGAMDRLKASQIDYPENAAEYNRLLGYGARGSP
ncbi:ankyrin repeat domain-containing protein [bacterium M00.F.Ca.ET.141.01.1.1]|nr:ankyrin repeat domain-containing protein [bacterium M00.F.Ca.ET.141.01.1.1]